VNAAAPQNAEDSRLRPSPSRPGGARSSRVRNSGISRSLPQGGGRGRRMEGGVPEGREEGNWESGWCLSPAPRIRRGAAACSARSLRRAVGRPLAESPPARLMLRSAACDSAPQRAIRLRSLRLAFAVWDPAPQRAIAFRRLCFPSADCEAVPQTAFPLRRLRSGPFPCVFADFPDFSQKSQLVVKCPPDRPESMGVP
jgi:hypothetical protein